MSINRAPLSSTEINQWFGMPPPPPAGAFEFALVLGGTVSAGAYTAGVVDFLIEALDELSNAQASKDSRAPTHRLILKVISGTSGGGVNAAIAARAFAYDFPHITRANAASDGAKNPFFNVWVDHLSLDKFLDPSDLVGGKFVSFLNGKPIDDGGDYICGFGETFVPSRTYVGNPLSVILTVTNLRGIPYRTSFDEATLGQSFIDHADYCRFAMVYPKRQLNSPRPDEFVLGFQDARLPQAIDWNTFSQYALATSAFPLGFPPRALARPTEHYRYRVVVIPSDKLGMEPEIRGRTPDWAMLVPGGSEIPADYHFVAVDGGVTDNEPIELARTALAGMTGRNPRDGIIANRAVVLIDPFAGQAELGPTAPLSVPAILAPLISSLTQQARYDSEDILLATDQNVFSRFMITAKRDNKIGGPAIASNGLQAFMGFACPAFMRHDFLLGRKNCQDFLRSEFALPAANPIFKGTWTDQQKCDFALPGDFLPLIPLFGSAAVSETPDAWPKHALDPSVYKSSIEARLKALIPCVTNESVWERLFGWLAQFGEGKVAQMIINEMQSALEDAKLS